MTGITQIIFATVSVTISVAAENMGFFGEIHNGGYPKFEWLASQSDNFDQNFYHKEDISQIKDISRIETPEPKNVEKKVIKRNFNHRTTEKPVDVDFHQKKQFHKYDPSAYYYPKKSNQNNLERELNEVYTKHQNEHLYKTEKQVGQVLPGPYRYEPVPIFQDKERQNGENDLSKNFDETGDAEQYKRDLYVDKKVRTFYHATSVEYNEATPDDYTTKTKYFSDEDQNSSNLIFGNDQSKKETNSYYNDKSTPEKVEFKRNDINLVGFFPKMDFLPSTKFHSSNYKQPAIQDFSQKEHTQVKKSAKYYKPEHQQQQQPHQIAEKLKPFSEGFDENEFSFQFENFFD